MYEDVLYEVDGTAAIITSTGKPAQRLRGQTIEELIHAFKRAWADKSVRGVIFTGAGTRAFCVGGDVKQRAETGDNGPTEQRPVEVIYLHRLIRDVPKPVIAAVNGWPSAAATSCTCCATCPSPPSTPGSARRARGSARSTAASARPTWPGWWGKARPGDLVPAASYGPATSRAVGPGQQGGARPRS